MKTMVTLYSNLCKMLNCPKAILRNSIVSSLDSVSEKNTEATFRLSIVKDRWRSAFLLFLIINSQYSMDLGKARVVEIAAHQLPHFNSKT